jgi:hypothetical protein
VKAKGEGRPVLMALQPACPDLSGFADGGDIEGDVKRAEGEGAGDQENQRENTENDGGDAADGPGQIKNDDHNGQQNPDGPIDGSHVLFHTHPFLSETAEKKKTDHARMNKSAHPACLTAQFTTNSSGRQDLEYIYSPRLPSG